MTSEEGSHPDHRKTSVFQLTTTHEHLSVVIQLIPDLEIINGGLVGFPGVGFSVEFGVVLPCLDGSAEDDELCPPLWIGLEDGVDGVGGGDVGGIEGSEILGPDPSDGGEHGGAAVGEFGLAGVFGGDPLVEFPGVVLG